MAASSSAMARPSSSSRCSLPPLPKKVKTEFESLIATQKALFDPEGCPGLAAVLQESMNDIPTLGEEKAWHGGLAWSL